MFDRRWYGTIAFALTLAACGGRNTPGGGDPDAGDGADAVLADAGVDADLCTGGTLCGSPAACCAAGNECVDDRCLAACASGVHCGADLTACCNAGEVCLAAACVVPGAACGDSYDCEPGQFCEPTLGQCLPQPDPLTCELVPQFNDLMVTQEWAYTADQIISIPVVANLDGVGPPEVVVNLTQQDGAGFPGGRVAILDGRTGAVLVPPIAHSPPTSYGSHGRSTIALGDVSGDARPDVIYASRVDAAFKSLIVAIDRTGAVLWTSHDPGGAAHRFTIENAAVTLANFDADPMAEVVIGGALLDHDGTVLWDQGGNGAGPTLGTNATYTGGIAAVADLDGDGRPEIITGKQAWRVTWNAGPPASATVTAYWTYAGADGYPAIADLDGDGHPEVVLTASAQVHVLDGRTGLLWCGRDPTGAACTTAALRTQPLNIPGGATQNRGGPPTIADFDGDGRPEIGVAGGHSYSLYDLARPGEDLTGVTPAPAAGAIFARWSQATQDLSSNASGSSVFDFQGDGAAEVVYNDECYMRVYSGTDGRVQLTIPSTTGTIHEYPLVVDVDGDGNSEIMVVANDSNAAADCPGVTPRRGLYVYGDARDQWVPTRRVWTQHAYHVTNATSAGNVPMVEDDNWSLPGLNNYRQNVQGDGVFNAPDLAVDLSIGLDTCDGGQLVLRARVTNRGALGVRPGVAVAFHRGTSAAGPVVGNAITAVPLLPGQSTILTATVADPPTPTDYFVTVDAPPGMVAECDETNNDDVATDVQCPRVD
ncbi:MAG: VCBS repeat-containing protein [Myxococcales bacterium]|nr:VCBS repeat-containing protein [Myxococcales bacterium]MBP6845256.1 VCBS repeat-containing protein [Kofleriaceae bacterium]